MVTGGSINCKEFSTDPQSPWSDNERAPSLGWETGKLSTLLRLIPDGLQAGAGSAAPAVWLWRELQQQSLPRGYRNWMLPGGKNSSTEPQSSLGARLVICRREVEASSLLPSTISELVPLPQLPVQTNHTDFLRLCKMARRHSFLFAIRHRLQKQRLAIALKFTRWHSTISLGT